MANVTSACDEGHMMMFIVDWGDFVLPCTAAPLC